MLRQTFMASAAILVLGGAVLATNGMAFAASGKKVERPLTIGTRNTVGEMTIPVNKSQMIRVNREFGDITVGNKEIADVVPISKTEAYVMGKKPGTTSIALMDGQGKAIAVVDVVVSGDMEGLKANLHSIMPEEKIEVRGAPGAIVLSGTVSSTDKLRQVLAMADRYAPGAVTNMMMVGGSQQVLLHVRFAEVQRTAAKELGIRNNYLYHSLDKTIAAASGESRILGVPISGTGSLGAVAAEMVTQHFTFDTRIDALENKGLLRTLAEPDITALSGETAKFLAGGEFPIPIANNTTNGFNTITVDFKEFGVGLSFTPTVIGKELINLVMKSEVSSIDTDPNVAVVTNQIRIPALKVRRANTTVELRDGESFAIAGLLQDDFRNGIDQVPGLGDVPVLGTLFRSSNFRRQQTELVVFITVHLVQPVTREALASPTDNAVVPNPTELFFLGKTEGQAMPGHSGGIDGAHGYIIP
jgi:pilus assembly protein CpaC